jgi:hypothetical protein
MKHWGIVLLGVSLLAGQAQASILTINFDNLSNTAVTVVTNQYPDVVFSSSGGDVILSFQDNPPNKGSVPNLICTGTATPIFDCTQNVILTFSVPMSNVSFDAFGNQTPFGQAFAYADVYENNSLTPTVANVPLNVEHTSQDNTNAMCIIADCVADHQSLTYANITELVIKPSTSEINFHGTAYDNFSLTTAGSLDTAPEPSTLLLTGFCGLALIGRRFLSRKRG